MIEHVYSLFRSPFCLLALGVLLMSVSVPAGAQDKIVTEYSLADFSDSTGWAITSLKPDKGSSRFENGVLTCDFSGQPGYIGITGNPGAFVGDPREVSLIFESDTSGHPIILRFQDAAWQFFQHQVAVMDTEGERTVNLSLHDMDKWYHFGGPDDGTVHPPIRLTEIIVDGDGPNAELKLIDVKVKTEIAPHDGLSLRLLSRKTDADFEQLDIELRNILLRDVKASYSWRVTDFFGKPMESGDEPIMLKSNSRTQRSLRVVRNGVKACEFSLTSDVQVDSNEPPKPLKVRQGQPAVGPETLRVEKTITTAIAVSTGEERSADLRPDSPFGMGIYLGQRYPIDGMDRPARMARDIGVKWSREEFNWSRLEPVKGEWHWDNYDTGIDTLRRNGVNVMGLLCYWSPWTKPYTEEGIRDYCSYVREVVGRYKDRIKHWEVWNEPNIFFWGGTVEQYADLLKAAYDTIKETDPDAKVVGCCTSGTDLKFIEQVFQLGGFDKMDILSIHPYRAPASPEQSDYIGELRRADALVRKYGDSKQIWITEVGWPTNIGSNGTNEVRQAAIIVRAYIQAIASGVVQKTFWYNYRNDGMDASYHEHNFGIVRNNLDPKPAYVAFGTMTSSLQVKRFVKALDAGKDVYAYLFTGKDGNTIAAWTSKGVSTLTLQDEGRSLTVTDLMGDTTSARFSDGRVEIIVSENPVFINGVTSDVKAMSKPLADTETAADLKVSVTPYGPKAFHVSLTPGAQFELEPRVTVRIPGYADAFTMTPGGKPHKEKYDLPATVTLDADNPVPVAVKVDIGDVAVRKHSNVYYAPIHRASRLVIDGDLSDWPKTPTMTLDQRKHVQELSTGSWDGHQDLSARVWLAWDLRNLYLALDVMDDAFDQTFEGTEVWKGDSVQFALDPEHLEEDGWGSVYELGLAQTPSGVQVFRWGSPEGQNLGVLAGARLVVKRAGIHTVYEAALPLASLKPLRPEAGKTIGFGIIVNDSDGEGRKGWVEWAGGIGRSKSPSLYGDITFQR